MSRLESIAVAGYYPTPPHIVPMIGELLGVDVTTILDRRERRTFNLIDPCAGEGAAIAGIAATLFDHESLVAGYAQFYVVELEATRFEELRKTRCGAGYSSFHGENGDAFRITWGDNTSGSLLYLNPPYDTDPVHGRLEERFLSRFTKSLLQDGILVFVVPFYALKASAKTLAKEFCDLSCFKFPAGDFEVYKQVVLVGKRRTLLEADPIEEGRILGWAANHEMIPELGQADVEYKVPAARPFMSWDLAPLDIKGILAKHKPWHSSDRMGGLSPITSVIPDAPVDSLLTRYYPLAMPPRPAHIASGIAAGIFNGERISPDSTNTKLPDILVKGAFDREFVTVDEKTNKDGETTGEVQVQQPKLVVTVLDLDAKTYHTVKSSVETTNTDKLSEFTTADLLSSYGRGLMKTMLDHCPVMHDPAREADRIELANLARPLYKAQADAAMAAVKLLGGRTCSNRKGKSVFILGELGSGKTSVALATAESIGAKRTLVMCPPHLLDSWKDQIRAVVPWVEARVLSDVKDVDDFANDSTEGPVIAILSRETAKLGHAWEGIKKSCPKCGDVVPARDLAKARERCEATRYLPQDDMARSAVGVAEKLLGVVPASPVVQQLLQHTPHMDRLVASYLKKPRDWQTLKPYFKALAWKLVEFKLFSPIVSLLQAIGEDAFTAEVVRVMFKDDTHYWGGDDSSRGCALRSLLLMEDPSDLVSELKEGSKSNTYFDPWGGFNTARDCLSNGVKAWGLGDGFDSTVEGLAYKGVLRNDPKGAVAALTAMIQAGKWRKSKPCGEPLFQAIPTPRRYPLATYIAKRHSSLIDLLILDESHDYSGANSAQSFAAHRLTGLGIPTIMMTGSVMNGYAESLFSNQWAMDPEFRAEFKRDQRQEFVKRYGYLKKLVENREDGKVVAFGSMSDRIETTERTIGNAPGVLPLFILKYLLRRAVTIHKADLALDLPPCVEIVERVEPMPEQYSELKRLERALVAQIRKDQFEPELAGKLWGQMAELPSYLDRTTIDVGNGNGDEYVVKYPDTVGAGVVAKASLLPASTILPKEAWMLAKVEAELAEGRRVMVFSWHVSLMPRLARLIEARIGEKVAVLDAGKVAAGKRQAWIDQHIIQKGRKVMVVNPVAIQTGLNNLVWFHSQIWMENPACNAIVRRQAVGRIDRIGQTKESRIYSPLYEGTTQEAMHKLLLHKVGVSMATDGLDPESALQAAGVGEAQAMSSMAVGRQLYEMLSR